MSMKKLVLATVLAVPGAAFAASAGNLDLYYVASANSEVTTPGPGGDFDDDGDGFGIKGKGRVADTFTLHAEYQSVDYDAGGELDQLRFGGGFELTPNFTAMVEYVDFDNGSSNGTDGFGVHGRFETAMSQSVSLFGQLGYLMLENVEDVSGLEFSVGAALQVAPTWSVWADYRSTALEGDNSDVETDLDDIRLGVRFGF